MVEKAICGRVWGGWIPANAVALGCAVYAASVVVTTGALVGKAVDTAATGTTGAGLQAAELPIIRIAPTIRYLFIFNLFFKPVELALL